MQKQTLDDISVYTFNNLSAFDNLVHFVSTRQGGISDGHFASMNIGFHIGDDNFRVLQNRRILSDAIGIDLMKFTFACQCHSTNVAIVDEHGRGKGALEKDTALVNTDGMVTNVKNICLGIQVADCVPVLLYDPVKQVIASLHAGWRGTIRKIAGEAILKMVHNYGSRAEDIYASLGPSNGPCCYEVGEDVFREARIALGSVKDIIKTSKTPGKYIFDQWEANIRQLRDAGVREENIELAGICSQCHHDEFFSSRAGNGTTGRFMAGIMLKKQPINSP
jgi:polyphenol oxidase